MLISKDWNTIEPVTFLWLNLNLITLVFIHAKYNCIYIPGSSEWYSSITAACELRPRDHRIFICASMNMCIKMMIYCIYTCILIIGSLDLIFFYFRCYILDPQDSSSIHHVTSFVQSTSTYYNDDAQQILYICITSIADSWRDCFEDLLISPRPHI